MPAPGKREKGMAVLITALLLLIVIPLVGLAVDVGTLYVIRGRLGAALDSAALAAGRSINLGNDLPTAKANATESARRFFKANFPSGYLGAGYTDSDVVTSFDQQIDGNGNFNGVLLIGASAKVTAPTYFMRLFKKSHVAVAASGTVARRNLVMMLVLDRSTSMGSRETPVGAIPGSISPTSSSCESMVFSAIQFVHYFSPYDNVGLVSFNTSALLDYIPSTNFKSAGAAGVRQAIANINCSGSTNTTAALELAYDRIKLVNQKLAMNVIVLFTDGCPNAVNADFPIRRFVDSRIGTAAATPAPPDLPAGNRTRCTTNNNEVCINMPVSCGAGANTVRGVISQAQSFSATSGARSGLGKSFPSDPNPSWPPGCATSGTTMTSQSLAYIPPADRFGNPTSGPKDDWLFQVNNQCAPYGTPGLSPSNLCKNLGGYWSNYPTISVGSNMFTSGPASGFFRTDHTNTIGAISMNTAINAAAKIRADPDFKVMIHSIYLQGFGGDPIDKEFLPIISNRDKIPPTIYEPAGTADIANPYYQSGQQKGLYLQTTSSYELSNMFAQIASSLLRIAQ